MNLKYVLVLVSSLFLSGCASLLVTGVTTGMSIAADTAIMAASKTIDGVSAGINGAAAIIDVLHVQPPQE
jgi:long-subunit fatty acid transport protein